MSKNKRKSAEKAPRPKDHSLSEVKEIALMLYAQRPFQLNSITSESDWNLLVRQAFDFLDNLDKAYARREKVAIQRKAAKENADALKALPDVVPFDKAVKVITGQEKLQRALKRFEALPLMQAQADAWFFRRAIRKPQTKQWRKQIAYWRKHGMKRDKVIWRRSLYDEKAYQRYRIAERAKKRQQWSKDRRVRRGVGQSKEIKLMTPKEKAPMRELIEEGHELELERAGQAKKQKKVNALLNTARTGEIE